MRRAAANDLDYLATRLHARRSRMWEGERLGELCRARSVRELAGALYPGKDFTGTADFQRRLTQDLAWEIAACLKHLDADDQDFIAWLLARFQMENAKVLLRGFLNQLPLAQLAPHLLALPAGFDLPAPALLAAKSLEDFVLALPAGSPRSRLHAVLGRQRESTSPSPRLFVLESALDAGYFQELLTRNSRLRSGEPEIIKPMIAQEANQFQFMTAIRGRFLFQMPIETLATLRVSGKSVDWLDAVLAAPDLPSAARMVVGIVLDAVPGVGAPHSPAAHGTAPAPPDLDISALERLAWNRYLRLANSAFRRSHMGVGAVAGYFGVRRREIANLVTLSECIRLGVAGNAVQARLCPQGRLEVAPAYV